ncbi:glycosyltransferase [Sediminicola luteus]|uniref:Glycosyltransferase family 4 protein n=1 Tax=Sediminicola luteus TaxID=319238 RepID=A0ABV2TV98_9FLAO
MTAILAPKKILIIGFVWPEPNSTAAGSRMLQLLHFFKGNNYQITFASTAQASEFSMNLEALGVFKKNILLNDSGFDLFLQELNPDIVLFDRFLTEEQFGWRVAKNTPNALRILDTEDLHSLRSVRLESQKNKTTASITDWKQADMTKREIASIYRCDLSLIISSYEMDLLLKEMKIDEKLLLQLPFMLGNIGESDKMQWMPFEDREDFVCIGNGKHAPNLDAIRWLKTEIWPLVRKQLPTVNLKIYGAYLPESILQLHQPKEGFLVLGRANDAKEVLGQARVSFAPLRFGAGIKGKLVDSMICGTPSVTTDVGVEGMHAHLPWGGKVSNDAESLAENAIALYTDKKLWTKCQSNGEAIINQLYDKSILEEKLLSRINETLNSLEEHRASNFIGSMLMHHSMASTKYMAKWIEAKNQ